MHIYRCTLTLLEATFFSSREVSATYQTEPLIGNIALAYAMGFCQSPYFNDGTIHYREHLSALNERCLYLTPGSIVGQPRFTLGYFNAQPDAYWYAMGAGALVTRPDGGWTENKGKAWWVRYPDGRRPKVGAESRPQFGRIRFLAIGNQAIFYILSEEAIVAPRYIRLGKFLSKARVDIEEIHFQEERQERVTIPFLLNPVDLPNDTQPLAFDLISVPPTPLIHNVLISGHFFKVDSKTYLPVGMRFGIERLP